MKLLSLLSAVLILVTGCGSDAEPGNAPPVDEAPGASGGADGEPADPRPVDDAPGAANAAAAPGCEDALSLHAQPDWTAVLDVQPDYCRFSACEASDELHVVHFVAPEAGYYRVDVAQDGLLSPLDDCAVNADWALPRAQREYPARTVERWFEAGDVDAFVVRGVVDGRQEDGPASVALTVRAARIPDADAMTDLPTCEGWSTLEAGVSVDGEIQTDECDDVGMCGGGRAATYLFTAPTTGTWRIAATGLDDAIGAPNVMLLETCNQRLEPIAMDGDRVELAEGRTVAIEVFREDFYVTRDRIVPFTLVIEAE